MQSRGIHPMSMAELQWCREQRQLEMDSAAKASSSTSNVDVKENVIQEKGKSNATPQPTLEKPKFYEEKEKTDTSPRGRFWQERPDLSFEQMNQMLMKNM